MKNVAVDNYKFFDSVCSYKDKLEYDTKWVIKLHG